MLVMKTESEAARAIVPRALMLVDGAWVAGADGRFLQCKSVTVNLEF